MKEKTLLDFLNKILLTVLRTQPKPSTNRPANSVTGYIHNKGVWALETINQSNIRTFLFLISQVLMAPRKLVALQLVTL